MRVTAAIILFGSPFLAFASEPIVTAHISREDVLQIRELISRVTSAPIITITSHITDESAPGAIPQEATVSPASGTPYPKRVYERVDLLWVRTGDPKKGRGDAFDVRRTGGTWKIVRKSTWPNSEMRPNHAME